MAVNRIVFCFAISVMGYMYIEAALGGNFIVDKYLQMATEELVKPLNKVTADLEGALEMVEREKRGVEDRHRDLLARLKKSPCKPDQAIIYHASMIEDWDFDSCVNVTDDARAVSEIAEATGVLALNVSRTALSIGKNMIDCTTSDALTTAKCYNINLSTLKENIVTFKNYSVPYVTEAVEIIKILRVDLDHCLGIPVTSRTAIENYLKNCN